MAFKVRPTAEVLSTINSNVPCPEEGCSNIFSSESNLTLHLAKTHGKSELMKGDGVRKEYHCPQVDCMYSDAAHFKTMKLLKQHYLKMHGEKKYICSKCSKGFPIESALKAHGDYCGVQFECPDCHNNYPCYETLKTHCRRKIHRVFKKQHYKLDRSDNLKSKSEIFVKPKEKYLLPKSSSLPVLVLPAVKPNSIDQSVQTDIAMELFRNDSRESQICMETQTIYTRTSDITLNKANIETQTNPIKSESKSCNTSFTSDNFDFTDIPITRNSSSTQTAMLSMNDLLDFTSASQNFNDFDFNCNMETQTDVFGDDLFNYSDYNGLIMSELGLNDTQTQTLLDDVRSVESQTMMSHAKRAMLSCRHMANMETQTDAEFKQMLDEINA